MVTCDIILSPFQHLHYFANSGGPADITPLDRLKRTVLPMTRYFANIVSSYTHLKGLGGTHCSDTFTYQPHLEILGAEQAKKTPCTSHFVRFSSQRSRLYTLFRHIFSHWPHDSSFRLVLETWLSFIQVQNRQNRTQKITLRCRQ